MSRDAAALRRELERMDRRPYGHYKDLRGLTWALNGMALCVVHVQGDPFAAPSRLELCIEPGLTRLPEFACDDADARRASADYLHRALRARLSGGARAPRGEGSGKSGVLEIAPLGQEVLQRTAVDVAASGEVRVRLVAGLPAAGRRILGAAAVELLLRRLPDAVVSVFETLDADALRSHVQTVQDQVALRAQLEARELVAFLGEGALLPRRSGADPRPLVDGLALQVPEALACELDAPHGGRRLGLAIRRGVTLIVGGGYHGKSTLLQALALGVYDHVPGDGREGCVTDTAAVTVRAEDGRATRGVDLTPFIHDLPLGRRTDRFDTDDASGSTSQAAAIIEALEAGASALLIDEDTAATNFMIRDARMRRLVPPQQEPITPYLDRVRELYETRGVSSVLVVGGAGDYLDVADHVVQMDAYQPRDVSAHAREVARALPVREPGATPKPAAWMAAERIPDPASLDPSRGRRSERVRSVKTRAIEFGREEIDVALLYQLVDPAQCRMIGDALLELSRGLCDGRRGVAELLDELDARIQTKGLAAVAETGFGDRARARRFEIAAALNRLRSLRLV